MLHKEKFMWIKREEGMYSNGLKFKILKLILFRKKEHAILVQNSMKEKIN
jgi:hypothetical protein